MFCGNCGMQIPDGTMFCPECGAKQEVAEGNPSEQIAVTDATGGKKPINKNRLLGIGAVAVVAIVLLLIIFGGRSDNAVVSKYIKYSLKGEQVKIMKLVHDKFIDCVVEENGYESKKELFADLKVYEDLYKQFAKESGTKYKSHKIVDEDEYSKSELKELKEAYKKEYGINIKVKAAKDVEVEVKYKVDGETVTSNVTLTIIKVGRNWYLDPESAD